MKFQCNHPFDMHFTSLLELKIHSCVSQEILCPGMEPLDAYENDLIDYEDGTSEGRKGCLQLVGLTDVDTLDVNPANGGASTDNDADVKFYDNELSD